MGKSVTHDDLELKVAPRTFENTRLYRDLEGHDRKIRRLVDANVVGVLVSSTSTDGSSKPTMPPLNCWATTATI